MAESTGIPFSDRQLLYRDPSSFFHCLKYHLCNAITRVNDLFFARKVDQDNLNFSAVVFINGPWCIETGNPLLDRKSTSWSYLCFMSCR